MRPEWAELFPNESEDMKATGKQWNDFLNSWPEGWWFDDADVTINGVSDESPDAPERIENTDRIELSCGVLFNGREESAEGVSLVTAFRKWIKAQNYDTLQVEVPKTVDRHHLERRLLEMFGAKVLK
jgi:hypothetical protein